MPTVVNALTCYRTAEVYREGISKITLHRWRSRQGEKLKKSEKRATN